MEHSKNLYEKIYEGIKDDILSGRLTHGQRLPSKRACAERYGVSVVTVENAYSQLIAEGYVRSAQRSGYFVQYSGGAVEAAPVQPPEPFPEEEQPQHTGGESFPFTVWARLMRSVILEKGAAILQPVRHGGAEELRCAISDYLYRARGFYAAPRRIIVGSGTEYLYNLLVQFLGRDKSYAVEDPGYDKLSKIYALCGVHCEHIPLDAEGMSAQILRESSVDVAHISPAHHYPTGIVMPITRRRALMDWAQEGARYIIEDDYDSEFRWSGKPVPSMFGMDTAGRVIYINTFSQTIAPSVRISYMCLPQELCERWESVMGFYSCPVPAFEQYTLARFIAQGYFERHINRTKKRFRRIREAVLALMRSFPEVKEITEENAGLHFTVTIDANAQRVVSACAECGVRVTALSAFYYDAAEAPHGQYVVSYAAADEAALVTIAEKYER